MAKTISEGAKSIEGVNVSLIKLDYSTSSKIIEDAKTIVFGSPSHNGFITLEMLVFLANIKQEINDGALDIKEKIGFAFGSYSWDGGICIEKLNNELKEMGFLMTIKPLFQINPIPDSTTKIQFQKECFQTGICLAKETL